MPSNSQVGGNTENYYTSVCKITTDDVTVGHTEGGATVDVKHLTRERKADEYGDSPVGTVHIGDEVTVRFVAAERTLKVLQLAYPFGYSDVAGEHSIGMVPGQTDVDKATELRLHPLASDDDSDDIVLYRAVVTSQQSFKINYDGDTMFDVTAKAYVDQTKRKGFLAKIGCSVSGT